MVFWIGIIVTFFGVIFTIAFTIYMVVSSKTLKKIKVKPNSDLIEIKSDLRASIVDSYKRGIIKTKLKRPNGTYFFEFYPTDVEQGAEVQRPDSKYLVVKKEFVKFNADGRRIIITILPRSVYDLPEDLRNTSEGDFLTKEGQKAWLLATHSKMMTAGDEAMEEIIKETTRLGLSKKAIASVKEDAERSKKVMGIQPVYPERQDSKNNPS